MKHLGEHLNHSKSSLLVLFQGTVKNSLTIHEGLINFKVRRKQNNSSYWSAVRTKESFPLMLLVAYCVLACTSFQSFQAFYKHQLMKDTQHLIILLKRNVKIFFRLWNISTFGKLFMLPVPISVYVHIYGCVWYWLSWIMLCNATSTFSSKSPAILLQNSSQDGNST